MKTLSLVLALNFFTTLLFSQKAPIKFGEIPMEDMKMTSYPLDSSASAVILADYGNAYITINSFHASLNFERHIRIKILKKNGLDWADGQISLYQSGTSEEKVTGLKAASYNLEGEKIVETRMSKDAVFKEKVNRNLINQKFTIPNVKEGSVIEYTYTVMSDFLEYFPNWKFQYSIPARHSEYWAVIPDFFTFEKYMQGYIATEYEVKPKSIGEYTTQAHHWTIKNVPAFVSEPYMTCDEDYVSKVNFALSHINFPGQPVKEIMGSWAKLNSTLLESELFGKAVTGNNFLKRQVEELTVGINDPVQKMNVIFNYVKQNLEWNGTKDFLADPVKKIFELKKGTAGDINITLAAMLEKAGIQVDLVLLSTRDHGFIRRTYPMSKQFNYVVCMARISDATFMLDATERYLPVNVLPERCLNGQGLVISKNNHGWIDIPAKTKAKTIIIADLSFSNSGEMKGAVTFTRDGYDAHQMRKEYFSKGETTYLNEFLKSTPWQIVKSEFNDVKEIDKPIKENHELTITEHAMVAGDLVYINPFVTSQLTDNPFKSESREYPVDFGRPLERTYLFKLALPDEYHVDELPKSKVLMLPGNAARYLFNVAQTGNTISITSTLAINKGLFLQDEYLNLREFYAQVVAKQSEQIVLKKR